MATTTQYILEGTQANFDRLVLDNSRKGLVVVDFWAPWAGPSLRQREVLSQLARDYQGRFLLVTVNTDKEKVLAERFAVKSLPSFKLFRHGKVAEQFHGMQPQADYPQIIDRHLQSITHPVQLAAAEAWNEGDRERALQVLAEGAVNEPDNLALPLMMAKLLMRDERPADALAVLQALPVEARDQAEAASLLAHVSFVVTANDAPPEDELKAALQAVPDDCDTRYRLAARHLLADEFEACLEQLMEILRRERGFRDGLARKSLLALFETLGSDHALIQRYRGELARLIH